MNKKVNVDKDALKKLYKRYRDYLIPVGVILFCFILFIYIIIPQMQTILALQDQQKEEERKLEILKNNLVLLTSLDSNELDKRLRLTSKALPVNKDFIGILNGVAIASSKAEVTLGDYGFEVGKIDEAPTNVKGIPSLEVSLIVNGDVNNLVSFIKEIEKTIPISEVKEISLTNRNAAIKIIFYYKSLPPVKIRDDMPLAPLSSASLAVINDLSKLNNAQLDNETIQIEENSSGSAVFSQL